MDFFLFALSIDFVYHLSEAFDCDDEFSLRVNKIPTKLNKGPCSEFNVCFSFILLHNCWNIHWIRWNGKSHHTLSSHCLCSYFNDANAKNFSSEWRMLLCSSYLSTTNNIHPPSRIGLFWIGLVRFGSEIECKQYAFDIQLRISRARFN